ncbi:BAZ1B [Mytilus coruscus]|uniref:BAZ1B n=1 Tax=Mytilus coruscus TaxID=42192 RepID=A0A6J8A6G3_MYTCO|nr:BAZ1B [Mytilus coruscus]
MAETMKMIEKDRNQTSKNKVCIELIKPSDKTLSTQKISQVQSFRQDMQTQDDINICLCPICKDESQENTIACDECNKRYHYICLRLTTIKVNRIDPDTPYMCDLCNYELLYENNDQTNEDTSYTQKPETSPIQSPESKRRKNCMNTQTGPQKHFPETDYLSRQENYLNGYHQDRTGIHLAGNINQYHQILNTDYESNRTCLLGNINSQLPFPGHATEQVHQTQQMGSNKHCSERDYNSSRTGLLNNRYSRSSIPRQRSDQELQHHMARKEYHLNTYHQDQNESHQARNNQFNHKKKTVHKNHHFKPIKV